MWKLKLQKIVADLLEKLLGNICFSEQIFYRKQSLGAPAILAFIVEICDER